MTVHCSVCDFTLQEGWASAYSASHSRCLLAMHLSVFVAVKTLPGRPSQLVCNTQDFRSLSWCRFSLFALQQRDSNDMQSSRYMGKEHWYSVASAFAADNLTLLFESRQCRSHHHCV